MVAGPSTVREVAEAIGREGAYTTVLKLLQIMTEKRLVRRDDSARSHVYEAVYSEDQTQKQLVVDLLDRVFDGSAAKLVMQALATKRARPKSCARFAGCWRPIRRKTMIDSFAASLTVRAIGWALLQSLWQGARDRRRGHGVRAGGAPTGHCQSSLHGRLSGVGAARRRTGRDGSSCTRATSQRRGVRRDLAAPVFPFAPTGVRLSRPLFLRAVGGEGQACPAFRPTGRWPDKRLDGMVRDCRAGVGYRRGDALVTARGRLAHRRTDPAHCVRPVSAAWLSRVKIMAGMLRVRVTIRLVESAGAGGPMVVGWLHPVILFRQRAHRPCALAARSRPRPRARPRSVGMTIWSICFRHTVDTLLFYHPATWWISRQIRVEREHCCDDVAVELCGDRLTYARALADLEQLRGADVELALAATGGPLLCRIRRLLGASQADQDHSPTWAVVAGPHGSVAHDHAPGRDECPGIRRRRRHSRTGCRRPIGAAACPGDPGPFGRWSHRERPNGRRWPIRGARAEAR